MISFIFNEVITMVLSVITDHLICREYVYVFNLKKEKCPSVKDVGCQTYTTASQS